MKLRPTEKSSVGIGNMNTYMAKIILYFMLLLSCSCGHLEQTGFGEQKMQANNNEIIISMILNHPDLQSYLHPEVAGRLPVKVITTKEMGVDYSVEKYGMPVSFYRDKPEEINNAFVQFRSFVVLNDECVFELVYPVEGVVANGKLKKINNDWIFSEFRLVER